MKLAEKERCTGCAACFNKCGAGAIQMLEDETGFLYPVIDDKKCIQCGCCVRVCPVLEKVKVDKAEFAAFIAQNKDEKIRRQSTSGGVFTAIAEQVIERGGVVFGAAFCDGFHAAHIEVWNTRELERLRGSKYIQSEIGDSYKKAEKYLKDGKWVCFSGTPCQIQGLLKYLGRNYLRLVTADVMCRAVPSPKIFHKYLDYQKQKYPSIDKVVFRDKVRGYSYSQLALYSEDKGKKPLYQGGSESDPWLRLFLGGYCNRMGCYRCQFQSGLRPSDITLWDCWGTYFIDRGMDDDKGTTSVIAWTEKGIRFMKDSGLRMRSVRKEQLSIRLERQKLKKPPVDLQEFYQDSESLSAENFIHKYARITLKIRLKSIGRKAAYCMHVHDILRRYVHMARKKRIQNDD